ANAHHPRHPHQQDSICAEPIVMAGTSHQPGYHGDWSRHSILALGPLPGAFQTAAAVLAAPRDDTAVLRIADARRQDVAAAPQLDLIGAICIPPAFRFDTVRRLVFFLSK